VRQQQLESCAIVALGTVAGLLLGWWMTPVVADLVLERVPGQPRVIGSDRQLASHWRVDASGRPVCRGLCFAPRVVRSALEHR
jgi:hypothetical protein